MPIEEPTNKVNNNKLGEKQHKPQEEEAALFISVLLVVSAATLYIVALV